MSSTQAQTVSDFDNPKASELYEAQTPAGKATPAQLLPKLKPQQLGLKVLAQPNEIDDINLE